MAREDFTLFWGGEFSQWYPSDFTIDKVSYNCAEQYMMHKKALFFGDFDNAINIMNTTNPQTQKAFGRQVRNFDADKWSNVAYDFVLKGNIEKFAQNPRLLEYLLSTEGTEIVEASPYDTIWGIGLGETDERAFDKSQWRGQNLLGKVLMETREFFKEKETI